ncbi:MAG: outer membrane protein assembly factor BamC [Zoogloeaceae bacterium]|jgi:outer membrane protein assembly factor BamC|nr:outer membrane protein assembly factor BamC [Zoogloeaceae bacterium]
MRQIPALGILFLAASLLGGCAGSLIPETKQVDYKSAKRAPTLEVPPDLTQITRDDRFAVPDFSSRGSATFSEYSAERVPGASAAERSVLPEAGNIRVERSGNQRWLTVQAPADKLWDSVKDFWQELGFIITTESRETGIMETDWAENRANIPDDIVRRSIGRLLESLYSTGERDKFRTRFEPGSEPGTTDIFISNRRMEEVYTSAVRDQTRWQPAPPDAGLEAEMLRRLMVRLGTDERRAQAAIAAARGEDRARLAAAPDGLAALEVDERFDRAWRRLGLALDRIGFTVEDRDRSQGIYFVRYIDPEADLPQQQERGWFSSLTSFWKRDPKPEQQVRYRIHAEETADKTRIRVLTLEGGAERSETARRILALLLDQLK